jgi:sec-independent protein translocase protein TatA
MGRIGLPELLVILFIVLLLFGAKKLPQISRSIGQSLKEFKKGIKEAEDTEEQKDKKEE